MTPFVIHFKKSRKKNLEKVTVQTLAKRWEIIYKESKRHHR